MFSVTSTSNHSGFLHHPHARGIHVVVFPLDVRELPLPDLVEDPLPQVEHIGEHVGLADQGQDLLRSLLRVYSKA
jgi:hypothetical protein